jgi:hypothetical protein
MIETQHLFREEIRAARGVDVEDQQHRRRLLAFVAEVEPSAYLHDWVLEKRRCCQTAVQQQRPDKAGVPLIRANLRRDRRW